MSFNISAFLILVNRAILEERCFPQINCNTHWKCGAATGDTLFSNILESFYTSSGVVVGVFLIGRVGWFCAFPPKLRPDRSAGVICWNLGRCNGFRDDVATEEFFT